MTPVPFIDLSRLTKEMRADVLADWTGCLDRTEFVGGPAIAELESKLCGTLTVNHALACANGTDALVLGLQAMGIKPGMRVAVPNLTFWATFEVIVQIGAKPVLVEVDSDDLQMSLRSLEEAHARFKLDAAIIVHLMGWASGDLAKIRAFCTKSSIRLLEDGAQCFGVQVGGKSVFVDADVSTLSFYPAKVVGGAMDGGAVLAKNKPEIDLARVLANHGRASHYSYSHAGWNSRMGGLQGRFLVRVLERWPAILKSRLSAFRMYEKLLAAELPEVKFWMPPAGVTGNGYLAVCTLKDPSDRRTGDWVVEKLKAHGIGGGRVYPETMDAQPPARGVDQVGELAFSRTFCKSVFNLPLFYGITDAECARSVGALKKVLRA